MTRLASGMIAAGCMLASLVTLHIARAEKPQMSPRELRELATHVVVGPVNAIYAYETKDDQWHTTHCVAEVTVEKVEKGDGLEPGGLVYARFWHRKWIGSQPQPPSTTGHSFGQAGDQVRLYLVNKGYDGDGKNTDGGYNVVFKNGCEVLAKSERPKSAAAR